LRIATQDVHARLHHHPGLSAVAAGTISMRAYGNLLSRLWGFHRAFEDILANPPAGLDFDPRDRARAGMLEADLIDLGHDRQAIGRLPVCAFLYRPRLAAEFMGALYVVEGSTMGGAQLARALAPLFDGAGEMGRRFFLGYGARNGAMWRDFVDRLDRLAGNEELEVAATRGAVATFNDFERWVAGWEPAEAREMGGDTEERHALSLG
jgi:heme oxygenase